MVTDNLLLFPYTASKIWEPMLSKILLKNNGSNEIFEKKIHGKEVSHERVKPLLRLFGQGVGEAVILFV